MPPIARNIISSSVRRLTKKRLVAFLTFFILKALCTLVVLTFYMGSRISTVHRLEDSLFMMMRRDGGEVAGGDGGAATLDDTEASSRNAGMGSNSTIQGGVTNNQSSSALMITPNLSDGTLRGKERLWDILQTRNVTRVDADYWATIPTWETVIRNIRRAKDGDGDDVDASPIIHGLETCEAFRRITSSDPAQRRIAPGGMFNTGTNYLSVLLEYNCQNPDRVKKLRGKARRGHGNEWEVPWGKHTPASARGNYSKYPNMKYTIDDVLPVVLIRNPYGWMKSMCRNPYTAEWRGIHDRETCPQLITKVGKKGGRDVEEYNPVEVKYGYGTSHHRSLGHLWNDWYGEYFYGNRSGTADGDRSTDAPFPRLLVRFEDIIFFPYEVTKQVCSCAGGVLGHREDDKDVANGTFHYVVRSAKRGPAHGPASQRNGLIDSWAKYGSVNPKDAYSEEEIRVAMGILDPQLMDTFGYG
ncbi:hypothetical protein ACHAW5_010877 [Stephanodiscus triporus]|uniref:Sulfotransferase domain-containing protein n=1 Tax=Stephanodiscus triporus TaxID=2934178 RepID=A0ABD3MSL6_9STRA